MTKAQIKFIQSLSRQKYRKEHNLYLVEGDKNAQEWLQSGCTIKYIIVSEAWLQAHEDLVARHPEAELLTAEEHELEKVTSLQHAQQVVLVAEQHTMPAPARLEKEWHLYLEKIQDPGNMGTIIRTADWFGIRHIICSGDCVEIYNPKVVQASMGSLLRVNVHIMDPDAFLTANELPLYAASLQGAHMHHIKKEAYGVIAMGNESQGLSAQLHAAASHKIMIPRLGGAESLNVAVATGILCAELILQQE